MRHRYLQFLVFAAALAAGLGLFSSTAPATAQETEAVELFAVCNNVALTWPSGTSLDVVAAAISPQDAVIAIWRFNNLAQRFEGYSPRFPEASDLRTANIIDAVFICMNAPGTLTRPSI